MAGNIRDGFPPGYEIRRPSQMPGAQTEGQRNKVKQSKSISDLQASLPGGIQGTPVEFDNDGIPQVEEYPEQEVAPEGEFLFDEEEPVDEEAAALVENIGHPDEILTPEQQIQRRMQAVAQKQLLAQNTRTSSKAAPAPQVAQRQAKPQPQQAAPQAAPQPKAAPQQARQAAPAQPQRKAAPPKPAQRVQKPAPQVNYEHPVLTKLHEKFGLRALPSHDLDIAINGTAMLYSMTLVPDELAVWALADAQQKAILEGDGTATSWFQLLHVCTAVVRMDHTPVHEIFDVDLSPEEVQTLEVDPNNLSVRVRKITGKALAMLMWKDTQAFGDKLLDFYLGKVLGERKVTSSFEKSQEGNVRYLCPQDGCSEYLISKPRFEGENELPFFCKNDGTELVRAIEISEESNLPLE